MTRSRTVAVPRLRAVLPALLLVATASVLVPTGTAAADPVVLVEHPHEGTAGALPSAAAEGYASRAGKAVAYTATPPAADGTTSMRFAGTTATYFSDIGLSSTTGNLVWSAPVLLPSLPTSSTGARFLAARTSTAALAGVEVAPTGRLRIRDGGGGVKATGTAALATGAWYRIEVLFSAGQATTRLFDASGTLVDTVGPATVTTGTPTVLRTGSMTAAGPILIDRVRVADDWLTPLPPPPDPGHPCGALSTSYTPDQPPRYDHVVVLMEENWSYQDFVASTQAPFLSALATQCGNEGNFHAATHPSQPNYMAATSGVASKVGVQTAADNIFAQVQNAGLTWKAYEESMPAPCYGSYSSWYKPGHNPAYFYTDLRSPTNTCATQDVPLAGNLDADIADDSLPAYSWITPNLCHDFYWVKACPTPQADWIPQGDAWLAGLLPRLTAMPSFQQGRTLIVVTFDEGHESTNQQYVDCTDPAYYPAHPDCQIPTVVVSAYITPNSVDDTDLSLYSLLATTEDALGLPRLAAVAGETSMRAGLGF